MIDIQFWIDTHKTIRYYSDKSRDVVLNNFELTVYAQLCTMLERYCKIITGQLELQADEIAKQLEKLANEKDDVDTDTDQL